MVYCRTTTTFTLRKLYESFTHAHTQRNNHFSHLSSIHINNSDKCCLKTGLYNVKCPLGFTVTVRQRLMEDKASITVWLNLISIQHVPCFQRKTFSFGKACRFENIWNTTPPPPCLSSSKESDFPPHLERQQLLGEAHFYSSSHVRSETQDEGWEGRGHF